MPTSILLSSPPTTKITTARIFKLSLSTSRATPILRKTTQPSQEDHTASNMKFFASTLAIFCLASMVMASPVDNALADSSVLAARKAEVGPNVLSKKESDEPTRIEVKRSSCQGGDPFSDPNGTNCSGAGSLYPLSLGVLALFGVGASMMVL